MLKVESFGIIPFELGPAGNWQVLLILHSKGRHWGFPKGKPNPQESPIESATRELKEETGLDVVKFLTSEPLTEQYQFVYQRCHIFKTVSYFPAIVSGQLQLQAEEVRDARWLDINEALSLLTFKDARHLLTQCRILLERS